MIGSIHKVIGLGPVFGGMLVKDYFVHGTPRHSKSAPTVHFHNVLVQRSEKPFGVKITDTFCIGSESGDVIMASRIIAICW
jgi:hypothetical protein